MIGVDPRQLRFDDGMQHSPFVLEVAIEAAASGREAHRFFDVDDVGALEPPCREQLAG